MLGDARLRHIPVIVVSGSTERLQATPQVVGILEKPFESDHLQSLITRSLSQPLQH